MVLRERLALALILALPACQGPAATDALEAGQLYCAKAMAAGPLVFAALDASGVPLKATGKAAGLVQAWCAVAGAIPVSPPAVPQAAPRVALAGARAG